MNHIHLHILTALAVVCAPLAVVSCQHGHEGKAPAAKAAGGVRVECPKCYRILTCCETGDFEVEGAERSQGVAWACPVHGYVATTPGCDFRANTCKHTTGKEPVRVVDPKGAFPAAIILRCEDCGAGGMVILEQKGGIEKHYCAD